MNPKRIAAHLLAPEWLARRAFPRRTLDRIAAAVRDSEKLHTGELRFAVEAGLPLPALLRDHAPRARAEEVFAQLRVWNTEHNSGVLVYVQLVDRKIEIVADRGISARVAQHEWDAICRAMEGAFRARRFEAGALEAVDSITRLLARHFPARGEKPNELPDRPALL
jgi:uncharacterized membrane protein